MFVLTFKMFDQLRSFKQTYAHPSLIRVRVTYASKDCPTRLHHLVSGLVPDFRILMRFEKYLPHP